MHPHDILRQNLRMGPTGAGKARTVWPAVRARVATAGAILAAAVAVRSSQAPPAPPVAESALREYTGVYRWAPGAYVYLQLWDEFTGFGKPRELVAFDESGEVRTLYPAGPNQFVTGPGMALWTPVESHIEFARDASGKITALTARREGAAPRMARRVEIEHHEDVRFPSGALRLAGTIIAPATGGKHPAVVLVHGSGAENRDYMLPWARFLVRHGLAILGYDKRGVGESTGDWSIASFQDLAADVVAAVTYLKTRPDIDTAHIGLLGISQAGWIMPLAAVQIKDLAFLISISGAGVTPAETTLDEARNELTSAGMPKQGIDNILGVQSLLYDFARTGQGWDAYAAARARLAARMGTPPPNIPGAPDAPIIREMARYYFYDPVPTLRQMKTPTLAIWGELDDNILPEKNRAAWASALQAAGNPDVTLTILPKANHAQEEAKLGSNAEMKALQRFVPVYFTTVQSWLARRLSMN